MFLGRIWNWCWFLSARPAGTYPTRYNDAECVFPVVRDQDFEQTSQEVQLISDLDGAFNYIVGIYLLESTSNMDSGPIQNFISNEEKEHKHFLVSYTMTLMMFGA